MCKNDCNKQKTDEFSEDFDSHVSTPVILEPRLKI